MRKRWRATALRDAGAKADDSRRREASWSAPALALWPATRPIRWVAADVGPLMIAAAGKFEPTHVRVAPWFNRRKQRKRSFSPKWLMSIQVFHAPFAPVWFFMDKEEFEPPHAGCYGVYFHAAASAEVRFRSFVYFVVHSIFPTGFATDVPSLAKKEKSASGLGDRVVLQAGGGRRRNTF